MESMLSLTIWITLLSGVITLSLLLCSFSRGKSTNTKKPCKQAPEAAGGWPLIGHLSALSGPELPHITLSKMAEKYGPIFRIRMGVYSGLVVSSSEIAKECLTTNDQSFSRRPKTAALKHMGYNFAMFGFSFSNSYWREVRKISISKLLSNQKVAMLGNAREIEVWALIQKVYESCGSGVRLVDMKKCFGDLNFNFMVRIIAGGTMMEKEVNLGERENLRKVVGEFFKMMGVFTISDMLPFLEWLDHNFGGMHKALKRTGRAMDDLMQGWLDDHKTKRKINGGFRQGEEDFMDQMLDVADSVAQELPELNFDADTINKATCQTMILGGTDTMTVSLTWALSFLLNNRSILKKTQDELDKIVGRQRQVKESDIEQLVYIQAILKETMRLQAPIPITARECIEDCEIAGFHVPSGTRLFLNTWKIHRDPKIWPDPLDFKPDRFLNSHSEIDVRGQDFELLPFGGGRRVCPGVSFSLQLMQLTLASLLHGFDITTPSNEPVDMTGSFGITNVKATALEVFLKPRLSPELYV
uniref:Flavonoid-6-hydroxylase n=1 Tax=Scoparia dulcis TaxID=107240 RepID=A0A1W7HBS8_SCODU